MDSNNDVDRLGHVLFDNWNKVYNGVVEILKDQFDLQESIIRGMNCVKKYADMVMEARSALESPEDFKTSYIRELVRKSNELWYDIVDALSKHKRKQDNMAFRHMTKDELLLYLDEYILIAANEARRRQKAKSKTSSR